MCMSSALLAAPSAELACPCRRGTGPFAGSCDRQNRVAEGVYGGLFCFGVIVYLWLVPAVVNEMKVYPSVPTTRRFRVLAE